jgi:hypothetical protein
VLSVDPTANDAAELRTALLATKNASFLKESDRSIWMKALAYYDRLAFGPPLK